MTKSLNSTDNHRTQEENDLTYGHLSFLDSVLVATGRPLGVESDGKLPELPSIHIQDPDTHFQPFTIAECSTVHHIQFNQDGSQEKLRETIIPPGKQLAIDLEVRLYKTLIIYFSSYLVSFDLLFLYSILFYSIFISILLHFGGGGIICHFANNLGSWC